MDTGNGEEAACCPRAAACDLRAYDWPPITAEALTDISAPGLSQQQRKRVLAGSVPLIADLMLTMDLFEDAVILLHEDGRMIHWNHAANVLASPVKWTAIHSLQMLGPMEPWASCRQLLRDYQKRSGFLKREIRDPGSGKCWDLTLTALAYLGATPRRLVLTVRDMTEDVRTREKLNEGEVMAATGALLAGAAHQAKNAIFGLSATLDALEANLSDACLDNRYVRHMRQGVAHMQVLMRDLLDYGNPSIGELQLTSLSASLRSSIDDCEALARASCVQIVPELDDEATVTANPSRLARAIENLLENAIQHSPQNGTVTIRIAQFSPDGARLDIIDQGPGFPPEHIEKLFTPFFTLRQGGTGRGLTIARKIIEDLGGAIRLANAADGGARVTVFLPTTQHSRSELLTRIREFERGCD